MPQRLLSLAMSCHIQTIEECEWKKEFEYGFISSFIYVETGNFNVPKTMSTFENLNLVLQNHSEESWFI